MSLTYAYGGPPLRGVLKATPEDFVVEETLGFSADGQGEHDLLWIEKRGANTEWVARGLARFAKVSQLAVGFAGLKDRHAVTRQHFSVQLPGRSIDWSLLELPGVRLLGVQRHSRKLKRGALTGNGFELVLREVLGRRDVAEALLLRLRAQGAPNYFGEQRFGRDGGNLDLARRLFAGAGLGRSERAYALSSARAAMFNAVLDQRVREGNWDHAIEGDLMNLSGRRAWFGPVQPDAEIVRRCADCDIHPTGPLWGARPAPTAGACAALEAAVAKVHGELAQGLESAGVEADRRALRMLPAGLEWHWEPGPASASGEGDPAPAVLRLRFALPAGAYATSLVRELIDVAGDWLEPNPSD